MAINYQFMLLLLEAVILSSNYFFPLVLYYLPLSQKIYLKNLSNRLNHGIVLLKNALANAYIFYKKLVKNGVCHAIISFHQLINPAYKTILLISNRWEQYHCGIYLKEVWLEILSFIGRGWFDDNKPNTNHNIDRYYQSRNRSNFVTHQYQLGSNNSTRMHTDYHVDDILIDYDLDDEDEQEEETEDDVYPYGG